MRGKVEAGDNNLVAERLLARDQWHSDCRNTDIHAFVALEIASQVVAKSEAIPLVEQVED